jgi:hypothetical protein
LMGLGILIFLVDVILVAGGNVHLSPGGDWWLQLWFVLLPAFVIFCLGATLYVLVEIALRVNSKP